MAERTTSGQGPEAMGAAKSVLLADDHPVVALGLRLALSDRHRLALVDTQTTPEAALAAIERLAPDALVADIVFSGAVRLDLIRDARRLIPRAAIVAFSSLPARQYESAALAAGADSFVAKEHPLPHLVGTLLELLDRPPAAAIPLAKPEPRGGVGASGGPVIDGVHLTAREAEIGRLIGDGQSVVRIAEKLGLSANTVAVHRDNIRRKLDVSDSTALVARLARLFDAATGDDR